METISITSLKDLSQVLNKYPFHTWDTTEGFQSFKSDNYKVNQYIDWVSFPENDQKIIDEYEPSNMVLYCFSSEEILYEEVLYNVHGWDPTEGGDDRYYDYNPSQLDAIIYALPQLTEDHRKSLLTEITYKIGMFCLDPIQAEEMKTIYEAENQCLSKYLVDWDPKTIDILGIQDLITYTKNL